MKLDEEMGAKDAPGAGAEYRFEEASAGASLQEEYGTRGGLENWKHIVIPVATLMVAVLIFLFGTDVIGRHGGIGTPGEPDSVSATTEFTDQR